MRYFFFLVVLVEHHNFSRVRNDWRKTFVASNELYIYVFSFLFFIKNIQRKYKKINVINYTLLLELLQFFLYDKYSKNGLCISQHPANFLAPGPGSGPNLYLPVQVEVLLLLPQLLALLRQLVPLPLLQILLLLLLLLLILLLTTTSYN